MSSSVFRKHTTKMDTTAKDSSTGSPAGRKSPAFNSGAEVSRKNPQINYGAVRKRTSNLEGKGAKLHVFGS